MAACPPFIGAVGPAVPAPAELITAIGAGVVGAARNDPGPTGWVENNGLSDPGPEKGRMAVLPLTLPSVATGVTVAASVTFELDERIGSWDPGDLTDGVSVSLWTGPYGSPTNLAYGVVFEGDFTVGVPQTLSFAATDVPDITDGVWVALTVPTREGVDQQQRWRITDPVIDVTACGVGISSEAVWEFAEADWTVCISNEAVWEFSEAEWSTCQDVVEVEPTPYYPSPPTVQDSGISALRRLDIGYYQVGVYSRGGEYRLTMLPRVTKISFGRSLDDTSSATVTCVSEEWADLIHPWQHEIHIFRNNILVWCGPVRDKAYDPETGEIVIDVRDLFAWMDFRTPHSEIDLVETDVADVFVALMESALAADPSPNILIDKTAVGSTIDFYYDPETPKIVAEDLRQMAEAGVDYTTFLRTVIIRGEYLDKAPIGTLLRSHLSKVPIIKESGEMATQLYLTGSGADVHAHPDAPLTAAQWDLHPYGLLEQVHDADKLFDSDDVSAIEKAGRSRYELVKDPRLFISDMRLAPSAPVEMNDLIPGRRIDVKLDVGAIPMISMYRLQGLQVEVDGTSETVTLEVTSLGDYDKDTPI